MLLLNHKVSRVNGALHTNTRLMQTINLVSAAKSLQERKRHRPSIHHKYLVPADPTNRSFHIDQPIRPSF
jgi:hypothetical protein